jgi:methionyl-tRNA formyltransferase
MTIRLLDELEAGAVAEIPQDDSLATYAPQLRKEEGEVDWTKLPTEIVNHVRAMQPWPGAFSNLAIPDRPSLRVSILAVEPTEEPADGEATPGTILKTDGELIVQSAGGPIRIAQLKPAGKREMTGAEFRRGYQLPAGSHFSA